jgi:UDP-glucose 4-epimerase
MNILITGGQGYIGGRLCRFISESCKHSVRRISRSTQLSDTISAPIIVPNWEREDFLRACCEGVDVIVHLAAMNAPDCEANPAEALVVNTLATVRLLEAAKKEKVRRFVYLSTAHVYGSPMAGCISETTWPQPSNPYATSHRAAEDVIIAADQGGQIEGIVLRLSNAFGAPVDLVANCWNLIFNDLCRQSATGETLILHSSGLQRRDFVPLTDVCRAIMHVAELSLDSTTPRLFNVGGNWAPTVWEVANLIADRFEVRSGRRPSLVRVEPRAGEIATDFVYQAQRLYATGFRLITDQIEELDALLEFCDKNWVGAKRV